ncbi:hypothetical protein ES705_22626 [subsurface metagenome]
MKKTNKKRSKIDGQWTYITHKITDSAPWKDLTPTACFIYFMIRKKWGGLDRGYIEFPYSEVEEFMAESTFKIHRNKLIEKGFIDSVERGGLWGIKGVLALSDRWKKWGTKYFIVIDLKKLFPKKSHFFQKGHQGYKKK